VPFAGLPPTTRSRSKRKLATFGGGGGSRVSVCDFSVPAYDALIWTPWSFLTAVVVTSKLAVCGRTIRLQPHELSLTVECAQCGTNFVPSQAATQAPASSSSLGDLELLVLRRSHGAPAEATQMRLRFPTTSIQQLSAQYVAEMPQRDRRLTDKITQNV